MFQISLKVNELVTPKVVEKHIPVRFYVDMADNSGVIRVSETDQNIGSIAILPDGITIKVDENLAEGYRFWQAFSLAHPANNPFMVCYGVIYQPDGSNKYQLDKKPTISKDEVIVKLKQYAKANNPMFVIFLLGRYIPGESIRVMSYRQIMPDGELGILITDRTFVLGNLENEGTM